MHRASTTVALAPEADRRRPGHAVTADDRGRLDDLVLDRYRLGRRLGAGGFGVVWQAHDQSLDREVAVKVVAIEDAGEERERAVREARAAARLNHPGIVALYELAGDEEAVYLVSELVRGPSLARLIHSGEVSDRHLAHIGTVLCDALDHAHSHGVIHRDLKPHNVLVPGRPASGAGIAKLADFGVAHLVDGDPLTHTGDVVGTLAYMAPEQARGRPAGEAADVYALALTLYEGWSGANPVRAGGPAATARRLGRPLPRLRAARRDLPRVLCQAIDRCLEPRAANRGDLSELRAALAEHAAHLSDEHGIVGPPRLERAHRPRAFSRRVAGHPPGERPPEAAGAPRLGDLSAARPAPTFSARLLAGSSAAALVLAACWWAALAPGAAAVGALAAAAVVFALPRLGWAFALVAAGGWVAISAGGVAGLALVAGAGLVPAIALLPRAGPLWSLPVLAPALGLVGLAPAFVAVAALTAGRPLRRAGLAAAGFVSLCAAELVSGSPLLLGVPDGIPAPAAWDGSPARATVEALWPMAASGRLAGALTWALLAAVLPLLVRGRSAVLDVAGAALWAGALTAVHGAMTPIGATGFEPAALQAALPGAALGAMAAVLARVLSARRRALRGQPVA